MKNRLSRYNNGFIGNNDSISSISNGTVNLNKKNTFFNETFSLASSNGQPYTPPSAWVSLPSFQGLTQYFAGVYGVFNNDSNFVTLQMNTSTGNYIVDWGDGTTGSFADNAIAYKQYTTTTYSGLTSSVYNGYKTLLIQAWPVSGTIVELKLNNNHNQSGLNTSYWPTWLNVRLVGSSCTNFQFYDKCRIFLEQIDFIGPNSITSNDSRFRNLFGLKKVVNWDTANSTDFSQMFNGCHSLIEVPQFDSRKVTNVRNMFTNCRSLINVPWMDTSNVTTIYEMFYQCYSLKYIPPFNLSKCTDGFRALELCTALEEIPWLDLSKFTRFNMGGAGRIKKLPNFSTTNALTNAAYFFNGFRNLLEAPYINTSASTSHIGFYQACWALEKVPEELDCSSSNSLTQAFYECYSLKKLPFIKRSGSIPISLYQLAWRANSIEEIPTFNTNYVTTFYQAFLECYNLKNVGFTFYYPPGQTWADATVFNGTFTSCVSLTSIGPSDVSGISGSTWANAYLNMFSSCANLSEVGLSGISENFSIQNCSLGPTALNDLYSRLAVVGASGAAAKTITVSGNWGTASDNPNIAIAKGWQVSG